MRIVVFGDSIAYGALDTEAGWVERIKGQVHAETVRTSGENKHQVINLGIGGNTSASLLARIDNELKVRVSASWPVLCIISIGTNDQRTTDDVIEVEIDQYQKNLIEILAIVRRYTDTILFVGLPPLGLPIVDFKTQQYSDERVKTYDAQLEALATENDVPYVALRPAFEERGVEHLFAYDNLHPNDEGHALIAETVKPAINRLGVTY